jgi:hypothetical protein
MSTRAVSPFIAFCKSKRDEVKAANPKAEFGKIGMLLSTLWKSMSQSEKDAYAEPRCRQQNFVAANEPELRRSSRLRNKRLGLNFWGCKINK